MERGVLTVGSFRNRSPGPYELHLQHVLEIQNRFLSICLESWQCGSIQEAFLLIARMEYTYTVALNALNMTLFLIFLTFSHTETTFSLNNTSPGSLFLNSLYSIVCFKVTIFHLYLCY